MNLREAAQQALEALEANRANWTEKTAAITALRTALAEPEQAPVAWMCADEGLAQKGYSRFSRTKEGAWNIPVYTHPPQRKPLTNAEIGSIEMRLRKYVDGDRYDLSLSEFARAIERAHGIGEKT